MAIGPKGISSRSILAALDAADKNSYAGSGSLWKDVSSNGNDSTLVNTPTFNSGEAGGGTLTFNGTNQYVSTLTGSGLSTFTISVWFRTTSTSSAGIYWQHPQIIGKSNAGAASGDFGIYVAGGNIGYWTGISSSDTSWTGVSVNDGRWKSVSIVSNGSSTSLYLNGTLQAGSSLSVARSLNSEAFWIAGKGGSESPGSYLSCTIGQFLFYSTQLTAQELLDDYNITRKRFGV